ncbi:MAG TPA: hypothetical protein VLZ89_04660 [Anaerolineales bacterium]|nr:hypothetical protein [Anaerolineales bacterium]
MKLTALSAVILFALALGSCRTSPALPGPSPAPGPPEGPPAQSSPALSPPRSREDLPQPATSTPPSEDDLINLAKLDLGRRLQIDPRQITFLKAAPITWGDLSLGCVPASGQILPRGASSGYQIWLQAGGRDYVYHAGWNGQLVLCADIHPGANNPLLLKTPQSRPQPPQANP